MSATYTTRADAEQAAHQLMERGVPEPSIRVRERVVGEPDFEPASGPSLGGGVGVEAVNTLVEIHDGDSPDGAPVGEYVVIVNTEGDKSKQLASQEVFGFTT